MNKPNWVLGTLLGIVFIFVLFANIGLFKGIGGITPGNNICSGKASKEDFLTSDAGWRFQKGQQSHWKYLVMQR